MYVQISVFLFFFFFNDTATTEIYTLSLHDALPILQSAMTGNYGLKVRQKGSTCITMYNKSLINLFVL